MLARAMLFLSELPFKKGYIYLFWEFQASLVYLVSSRPARAIKLFLQNFHGERSLIYTLSLRQSQAKSALSSYVPAEP